MSEIIEKCKQDMDEAVKKNWHYFGTRDNANAYLTNVRRLQKGFEKIRKENPEVWKAMWDGIDE